MRAKFQQQIQNAVNQSGGRNVGNVYPAFYFSSTIGQILHMRSSGVNVKDGLPLPRYIGTVEKLYLLPWRGERPPPNALADMAERIGAVFLLN